VAALLFAAAFPNPLFHDGFAAAAYVAYLPLFCVIYRANVRACVFFGALFGFLSTIFFNWWLYNYHPVALPVVAAILLVYYALFFPLLRLAVILFPRRHYLVQWLLWLGFEYLRSLGFLGYTYGISGYSQWRVLPLLQIASVGGVWAVSAFVLFPQIFAAWALNCAAVPRAAAACARGFFGRRDIAVPVIAYGLALACALVYGIPRLGDYGGMPWRNVALIQQNDDPWKNNVREYRETLRRLRLLSDRALDENPDAPPALVVWPETAFIPMIYWHTHYRTDNEYYQLVKDLRGYLAEKSVPFLIGNDDGRRETRDGRVERVDYNAALLFEGGELRDVYRKQHLVPFAEYFPYKKQLPFVNAALAAAGFTFWEPGSRPLVFETRPTGEGAGLRFSTPICFEDAFGDISRTFTQDGAQLIVNITNDSWGASLSCQMQHLAMSVVRAVENGRSVVRAATSGQTAAIAPDGRILAMAVPFTQTYLNVNVPISDARTWYTRGGDFLPRLCLLAAALAMAFAAWRKFRATLIKCQ
jgi:apolipoprotein N-acyltransferase